VEVHYIEARFEEERCIAEHAEEAHIVRAVVHIVEEISDFLREQQQELSLQNNNFYADSSI
jgi:hypothetical protein